MSKYTFFVDESCHLEHDASPIMCVGAIKVPDESIVKYKEDIKAIKRKYGILHEVKWNTISNTHVEMYKELIDYFFSSEMDFDACLCLIRTVLTTSHSIMATMTTFITR